MLVHHPHGPNISLEQGGPSPKTTTVSRLFPPLIPLGLGLLLFLKMPISGLHVKSRSVFVLSLL